MIIQLTSLHRLFALFTLHLHVILLIVVVHLGLGYRLSTLLTQHDVPPAVDFMHHKVLSSDVSLAGNNVKRESKVRFIQITK